jgi:predicted nucleic acid-binding protein
LRFLGRRCSSPARLSDVTALPAAVEPASFRDFLVGAHAGYLGVPLLTRDTRRHQTCFPQLVLIAPDSPQIG